MLKPGSFPIVSSTTFFKETIEQMTQLNLGIACVISANNELLGVITDGDIRRQLLMNQQPFSASFVDDSIDHCTTKFQYVHEKTTLSQAVDIMDNKKIWDLPVLSNNNKLTGLLHLHPAVKALIENNYY